VNFGYCPPPRVASTLIKDCLHKPFVRCLYSARKSLSVQSLANTVKFKSPPIPGTVIHPVKIEGRLCEWVVHEDALDSGRVVYYLHGGGYCVMNPASHRSLTSAISKMAKAKVLGM